MTPVTSLKMPATGSAAMWSRRLPASSRASVSRSVTSRPEPVDLELHGVEEVVAHGGIVLGAVVEQLEDALERGDGRAHLVARVGDELALCLLDAMLLGDVGEQQHGAVGTASVVAAAACRAGARCARPACAVASASSPSSAARTTRSTSVSLVSSAARNPTQLGTGGVEQADRVGVDDAHRAGRVEGDDALGHRLDDGGDLALALLDRREGLAELLGHPVVGDGQVVDLVRRDADGEPLLEVAVGDR